MFLQQIVGKSDVGVLSQLPDIHMIVVLQLEKLVLRHLRTELRSVGRREFIQSDELVHLVPGLGVDPSPRER